MPKPAALDERFEALTDLGFTDSEALELALAEDHQGWPVSIHAIRQALENGCSHELALKIFQ
jgi:hypothetical protein